MEPMVYYGSRDPEDIHRGDPIFRIFCIGDVAHRTTKPRVNICREGGTSQGSGQPGLRRVLCWGLSPSMKGNTYLELPSLAT